MRGAIKEGEHVCPDHQWAIVDSLQTLSCSAGTAVTIKEDLVSPSLKLTMKSTVRPRKGPASPENRCKPEVVVPQQDVNFSVSYELLF